MFANDVEPSLEEDPELLKMKIKFKIDASYKRLGETPGVLVDRVARQKILKDLGH